MTMRRFDTAVPISQRQQRERRGFQSLPPTHSDRPPNIPLPLPRMNTAHHSFLRHPGRAIPSKSGTKEKSTSKMMMSYENVDGRGGTTLDQSLKLMDAIERGEQPSREKLEGRQLAGGWRQRSIEPRLAV